MNDHQDQNALQMPEDGGMGLNTAGTAREMLQPPVTLPGMWVQSRQNDEDSNLSQYLLNLGIKYRVPEIARKSLWDVHQSIAGQGQVRLEAVQAVTGQLAQNQVHQPTQRRRGWRQRFGRKKSNPAQDGMGP